MRTLRISVVKDRNARLEDADFALVTGKERKVCKTVLGTRNTSLESRTLIKEHGL